MPTARVLPAYRTTGKKNREKWASVFVKHTTHKQ